MTRHRPTIHTDSRPSRRKRLRRYAVAAGGAVLALGGANAADAALIYFDPPDVTIGPGPGEIYFDLDDSAGGVLVSTSYFAGADFYLYNSIPYGDSTLVGVRSVGATGAIHTLLGYDLSYAGGLLAGTTIDGAGTYTGDGLFAIFDTVTKQKKKKAAKKKKSFLLDQSSFEGYESLDWHAGGTGFLGLRLDAGGGDFNYGWVQLTYEGVDQLTLHDFALETVANAGITTTGVIPEPSSFGLHAGLYLLAMGAAGVYALRRRRKSAGEDASEPAVS